MNSYIRAVTSFDLDSVAAALDSGPKWLSWSEPSGKNALHYLCGVNVADDQPAQAAALMVLKLLLKRGMNINSVHRIEDSRCEIFPATPLWYAYTRGRNPAVYKHLLKAGADPSNCWWAIGWYDDVQAAKLWIRHGAAITEKPSLDELYVGSMMWKKFDFADWLLTMGADVDARDPKGNTALITAVKRRDENTIRRLIAAGADPGVRNDQGQCARDIAAAKGPKRLLDLLQK